MRKPALLAAVIIAVATLLSGCHGTTHARAHAVATSAIAKAQEARAQAVLDRCLKSHSLLTSSGRAGFESCALPASERASFGACLKAKALSGGVHLHGLKAEAKSAALACLLKAEGTS